MRAMHAHEEQRFRAQIASLRVELDHRANIISALADALAETRAELDITMRLGQSYADSASWMSRATLTMDEEGTMLLRLPTARAA